MENAPACVTVTSTNPNMNGILSDFTNETNTTTTCNANNSKDTFDMHRCLCLSGQSTYAAHETHIHTQTVDSKQQIAHCYP